MPESFEWAVAGVVVVVAGAVALAAAAFLAVPMVAYSYAWWRLWFEV
jgi:hypothetical protein